MPTQGKRGRPRKIAAKENISQKTPLEKKVLSVKWSESYTSLLMGVVVVIVAVLFVVSILRQSHHIQQTSSIATAITPTITTTQPSLLDQTNEKTYTVQSGDNLWSIAEKYYNSGYNWIDIAKANNLADPSTIHVGNQLIIPSVTPQPATITITPNIVQATQNSITGNTYTVKAGDDLWSIAVRAYADGYQWTKIAEVNNLSNPSLIFSGNVLQIPR